VYGAHCADFLTGVYHWGVDNYGSGKTPVVGSQIAAFQGHHQKPWTITEREFCNNVHKVRCAPACQGNNT
jgi:ubiquitin-conjugating enzyme E2 variant